MLWPRYRRPPHHSCPFSSKGPPSRSVFCYRFPRRTLTVPWLVDHEYARIQASVGEHHWQPRAWLQRNKKFWLVYISALELAYWTFSTLAFTTEHPPHFHVLLLRLAEQRWSLDWCMDLYFNENYLCVSKLFTRGTPFELPYVGFRLEIKA